MKTLKVGDKGDLVGSLQTFLNNFLDPDILVDGDFGVVTENAVIKVQKQAIAKGFNIGSASPDGNVGPMTAGAFQQMGWEPYPPSDKGADPNFAKPSWTSLNSTQRVTKFGKPGKPLANAVPGGPIDLDPSFGKNVIKIKLSDHLTLRSDFVGDKVLSINKKVQKQWEAVLKDIHNGGHDDEILSCGGSWNARYVRGSTSTFSSHAFATAVDFNAPQNWLKATPARKGSKGYLGNIVAICRKYKIYWGGHFERLDGMHFESTCTDEELKLMGII